VRAMILAAGEGRRLRPLTETLPKALVEVGGKPLIDYAVETAARSGIQEVVVNLHHLGGLIRSHLGDGSRYGVKIFYSEEAALLGSGGGIAHARRLIGSERFVTLNADTIVDIDLAAAVKFHTDCDATATLVLRKDPRMREYGLIQVDRDKRVCRFLQYARPDCGADLDPHMFTGVQVLEPSVFDYMPQHAAFSITEVTYPAMLAADERIFGYPFEGGWWTVGTPEELAHVRGVWAGRLDSRKRSGLS
jgi:NDP-sugar pyrophosphorylase family protein